MKNYKVKDFLRDLDDFCNSMVCEHCPLSSDGFNCTPLNDVDGEHISVIYYWKQNQKKTFLQDLKEKFPSLDTTYILDNVCPSHFGYCTELEHNECMYISCEACWNRKE